MTIEAEYAALQRASDLVADITSALKSEKTTMHDTITSLVDAGWHGQASDAYRHAWSDWTAAADRVLEALGAESALLARHKVELQTTDGGVTEGMSALSSRLGGLA